MAGGEWGAYEDQDNCHHGGLCGLGECSSKTSQVWAPRYYAHVSRYRNNRLQIRDVEVKIQSAVPVRLRHHLLTRPRTVRDCPHAPVQVRSDCTLGRNGHGQAAGSCLLFSAWSTVLSGRHRLQVCLPYLPCCIGNCCGTSHDAHGCRTSFLLPVCLPARLPAPYPPWSRSWSWAWYDPDPDPMLASTTAPGSPVIITM